MEEEIRMPCIWDESERCSVREILFYPEPKEPNIKLNEEGKFSVFLPQNELFKVLEELSKITNEYVEKIKEIANPLNEANLLHYYCRICPKHRRRLKEVKE